MDYSFGSWIKRRRKALDMTQQELANRLGCSVSLIFKIESDERRPSRQIAELLTQLLEIPADQRTLFMKVARQEKSVDRLDSVPPPSVSESFAQTQEGSASASQTYISTLPRPLTPVIGRAHELDMLIQQVQNPGCRLLTLTGPGGVGKTLLAMETANQVMDSFPHGAGFVSLVGTSSPEFIVPAIADTLNFVFSGTIELKSQLFNFLKSKQLLLVLDNLEHLLDGVELLDELLKNAPGVKLLTTSREPLHLQAEWTFEVRGLPIPMGHQPEELEASSAAQLFIQRVRQVQVGFTLTDQDQLQVLNICRLVQGLPLAIELAATWVRSLSCEEIAQEIERNIEFLTVSSRDLPERHRSITAVFDHSWKLLSDVERQTIQQLSVFRGGFTREAAEQIAGASLQVLSALVEKSLVRRDESKRYVLHELIRQYAAARLSSNYNNEQTTKKKHAEYYLTLLDKREPGMRSQRQKETLDELRSEIDNFRTAWDFALTNKEIDLLRIATGPMYYFYELHQYFQEVEAHYRRGAETVNNWLNETDSQSDSAYRAKLEGALGDMLTHQAFFLQRMGRIHQALELHDASIALLKPLQESYALTYALVMGGVLRWAMGDFNGALEYFDEGLPISRTLENAWLLIIGSSFAGSALHDQGKYDEASVRFDEAIRLCHQMKDPYVILLVTSLFSRTAQVQGKVEQIQTLLKESLQIARESGNRWGMGLGLEQLAEISRVAGDFAEARKLLEESILLNQEVGDNWSLARALNARSQLAISEGNLVEAEKFVIQSIQTAIKVDLNSLDSLSTLIEVYARQEKFESAFEVGEFILSYPGSSQTVKDQAGRSLAEVEKNLSASQREAIQSRIRSMTFESFIKDVLAKSA